MKNLLPKAALALLALAFLAGPALAGHEGEAIPGVTVTGRASQEFIPDQGRLTLGVTTQAPSAAEAAKANAAAMEKIMAALKAKLGPQDHLRTVSYRLYPKTEWDAVARKSRRLGFEASNRVEVTSRDAQALGAFLDAATVAGANDVSGPVWSLSDPPAARRQVQTKALEDARAQAQALAQAAGVGLGRIVMIQAGDSSVGFRPPGLLAAAASQSAGAAPETSLEPGVVQVQAEVTCAWALAAQP